VNSEITKVYDNNWLLGWVLFDAACPSCCRIASLVEDILTRRGFDVAPLQSSWVAECLDSGDDDLLDEMRVITLDGHSYAGADAILFLAGKIWWASPVAALALFPGVRVVLRRLYGFWAKRRCTGACKASRQSAQLQEQCAAKR
jgi:predicted DCC family thiol-disulfide oxidoreductase YuxK